MLKLKNLTSIAFSTVLLSSALLLVGCDQDAAQSNLDFKPPVTVADVTLETVEQQVNATGTLRAEKIIKLTVLNRGLLYIANGKNGRYGEGDSIVAGEVIANVAGEELRLTVGRQVAEQRLQEAKVKLEATKALFVQNLASATMLEQVKSDYESAKLEVETSNFRDSRSKFSSPINGVIMRLGRDQGQPMADGQLVESGQLIAEIASIDVVIADVDLVGKDIARVSEQLNAKVKYYAWKDKQFDGVVRRIHPRIDERSRALKAEIAVQNPGKLLKPGMFVEVAIVVNRRENVPVVPTQAITRRGGRDVVFVLNGQRVEQRDVELGLRNKNRVEVIRGVSAQEQVVVLGLETLTDQMIVRIVG